MDQNNNGNFFTSAAFKWIMVVILEIISLAILVLMIPTSKDADFVPLIVYVLVCIVLSIGVLFKLNKKIDTAQMNNRARDRQTERYMASQMFGAYAQPDSASDRRAARFAILIALSVLFSPFIAPYVLGKLIHSIICRSVGNQ